LDNVFTFDLQDVNEDHEELYKSLIY
jgi:hypothetical protein